jgi:hypothetical protein
MESSSGGGGPSILVFIIELGLMGLWLAGMWKTFVKAGKPGWAAIVPIYNFVVLVEIAGRPVWWVILMLIPCVNLVVMVLLCLDVAKAFGKSAGFGIGLAFLSFVFYPMLGFGDAEYQGPPQHG